MRRYLAALAIWGMPWVAAAEGLDLSHEIGRAGLSSVEARLSDLPAPQPEELFALAGVRFLSGVEGALQLRWRTGLEADWSELPILRLPIGENPQARALVGADITALLAGIAGRMDGTRGAIADLGDKDFALQIDLADLWFDINENGQRDPGEDVWDVAGMSLGIWGEPPKPGQIVVRFDTADAAWLSAYSHLLSGVTSFFQAYDPAPAVDAILASTVQMRALWGDTQPTDSWDMMFGTQADRVAIILKALGQKPDAEKTRAALGHLRAMVAENLRFWQLVEAETDNDQEWIPNDRQVSALGIEMPEGTGARWQAVLADLSLMLEGKALIPHWRFGFDAGINLAKLLENPPPLDLVGLVQGVDLLPYAEAGALVSGQSWDDFERLVAGDSMLFAVFLN